jgi:protein transport protein SEC13
VWSISWAHPKFGTLLASSSYSGQVLIHREQGNVWSLAHSSTTHAASVNAVAWAPHEVGAFLAAASSDGTVSLVELQNGSFQLVAQVPAHGLGANAVSWAPAQAPGSLTSAAPGAGTGVTKRFVTGGSDGAVKIWEVNAEGVGLSADIGGHQDWVRDVAWSSTVLRRWYIASASEDRTVKIWTSENGGKFLICSCHI